ncbi:MAG: hypothetical protein A2066_18795 [Bacteroidetes bacterium GWB2_41_8]|nr:MAG: hypothetical protein A2066_18795 [Bacteroidetes bacterium GWB2_41_8]
MQTNKTYDILELQKLSIIELTTIADQAAIKIQNSFKQGLIYAILDRQSELIETCRKPSECHSRDCYAVADQITNCK